MADINNIIEYQFTCPAINGLHARPANRLEQIASGYSSQIIIENLQNGKSANARSILSLIAADVKVDDKCLLKITGDDSDLAYKELTQFIEKELPIIDDDAIVESENYNGAYISPVIRNAGVKVYPAKPVTSGFGIGHIVHIDDIKLPETLINSEYLNSQDELALIENAFDHIADSLKAKAATLSLSTVERQILQAHKSIINDSELKDKIKFFIIENKYNAAKAIITAFKYFSEILCKAQSQLIRDRISDLQDIRNQLLNFIYGNQVMTKICLDKPSICVADSMSPSDFISLDKTFLKGLILKEVGPTSHIVILARSCNIPIITDVQYVDFNLPEGQQVIIDSNYGFLLTEINEQVNRFYDREKKKSSFYSSNMAEFISKPATTQDKKTFKVMANIAMASEVETAIENGADGIGLFRTEIMLMGRDCCPAEQELFEEYKKSTVLANGKSVTIRTFDIGGDKNIDFIPIADEKNPTLGYRGVRVYQKHKELLHTQLSAILRASAFGPIQIVIPMVTSYDEVLYVCTILNKVKQELDSNSINYDKDIKLGIMAEVPSVLFIIDQLADLIDFINIGTNDLKQYYFAADRENQQVYSKYPDHHPAFLNLVSRIISEAHNKNLYVCVCGEMANSDQYLPLLIGAGIDSLSVSIPFISRIKAATSLHNSHICYDMLKNIIKCSSIDQVSEILAGYSLYNTEKSIIETELIDLDVDCNNKEEVIKHIVDTLFLDQRTNNYIKLEEDFWKREEIYSTGLGHGFAIPHCKTSHISKNSICVFRLKKPIEWQSIDSEPVNIVIAMTIRENQGAGNAHMNIFSRLARNIVHKSFRNQLKSIEDKTTIVKYLREQLELSG